MQATPYTLIGIDAATEARKTGITIGKWDGTCFSQINSFLENAIPQNFLNEYSGSVFSRVFQKAQSWENPILCAVDVPFGWPINMAKVLSSHSSAGDKVEGSADMDRVFMRTTDRFIKKKLSPNPLSVGADKIARTMVCTLNRIHEALESQANLSPHIITHSPQGIEPNNNKVNLIEVYPTATLAKYCIEYKGYKSSEEKRMEILNDLELWNENCEPDDKTKKHLIGNDDVFDSLICCRAAIDFLNKDVYLPKHSDCLSDCFPEGYEPEEVISKEGWIWVRESSK